MHRKLFIAGLIMLFFSVFMLFSALGAGDTLAFINALFMVVGV